MGLVTLLGSHEVFRCCDYIESGWSSGVFFGLGFLHLCSFSLSGWLYDMCVEYIRDKLGSFYEAIHGWSLDYQDTQTIGYLFDTTNMARSMIGSS